MLEIFVKAAALRQTRRYRCARQAVVAMAAMLALAGCAAPPRLVAQGDPSDPVTPVRPVTYRSTLGPYRSARPVDPAPWRLQNERAAPQPSEGGAR